MDSLRILHVLTFLDSQGSFGGPATVALDLANAQQSVGHRVGILALGAHDSLTGITIDAFRPWPTFARLGFAGYYSPRLAWWAIRNLNQYDVVHIHLARDLVTAPTALVCRIKSIPYILQPHGMIDHSKRRMARLLDGLLIRPVLRSARVILGLTEKERADVEAVARAPLPFDSIGNGLDVYELPPTGLATRAGPILFVGRLHPRKRPVEFVKAVGHARSLGVTNSYLLIGSDEGEVQAVSKEIQSMGDDPSERIAGPLPRASALVAMSSASVLVAPTDRERFGMAMIEAMALGVPVVSTASADLAETIADAGAGLIAADDFRSVGEAIYNVLEDEDRWTRMSAAGRSLVVDRYSLATVCQAVEQAYMRAVGAVS